MKKKLIILYLQILKALLRERVKPVKIIGGKLKGLSWGFSADTNNELILGNYESELQRMMSDFIHLNNTVYDIGAHHGYFTLLASKLIGDSGRVFAFEPMPQNFHRLAYNIKLNKSKNVNSSDYAISDKEAILEFSDSGNAVANTYISGSPLLRRGGASKIAIKAISLDVLFDRKEIAAPQFMKIDVEGAEFDVLEGAQKVITAFKPVINLSTHDNHNPGVSGRCLEVLKKSGYKVISSQENVNNKLMQDFFLVCE